MIYKNSPWVWSLYDFANSLASIVVSFYFSLFIVSKLDKSDMWVSAPVAFATFLLFVTLPFLGHITDKLKKYKPALAITTLLSIGSLFLLGISAAKNGYYTIAILDSHLVLFLVSIFLSSGTCILPAIFAVFIRKPFS